MSNMHQWIICAAVLSLSAGTAAADKYEIGFASGTRWMRSGSVDTLTADDAHGSVGLGGAIRLEGIRPFGFDLYVDGDYTYEGLSGTTYQRIDTDLSMHAFRAGVRAEHDLEPWLSTFGRMTLGYTTAALSVTDQFSSVSRPTSDRAHAGTSSLGGGLNVRVIRSSRVTIVVRTELDYTKVSSLHFQASPEMSDDGVLTIPVMAASLGDVDVSGLSLRFGLVGQF